jgi:hypothetical protein
VEPQSSAGVVPVDSSVLARLRFDGRTDKETVMGLFLAGIAATLGFSVSIFLFLLWRAPLLVEQDEQVTHFNRSRHINRSHHKVPKPTIAAV